MANQSPKGSQTAIVYEAVPHTNIMDFEECKRYARAWLAKNGYHKYTISSVSGGGGTTPIMVQVSISGKEWFLNFDNNDGSILKITKERSVDDVMRTIVFANDDVSTYVSMNFELYSKVKIGTNNNQIKNVELIHDKQDPQLIEAFRIRLVNTSEEEVDKAYMLAGRLVNYLSAMTGTVVEHKRPLMLPAGMQISLPSMLIVPTQRHGLPDDLESSPVEQTAQILSRFKEGYKALRDNDFAEAIRCFYLIIENDGSPSSTKYKSLRNGVSHDTISGPDSLHDLKQIFGLNVPTGGSLNLDDPKVQSILYTETHKLHRIAQNKVEREITNAIGAYSSSP